MIKTLFQKLIGSKEEKTNDQCCATMTLEKPIPSSNEKTSSCCSGTCCGSTSTTVDVVLTSAILNRVLVVKALKEITGRTEEEANQLFDARPGIIKERIERDEAEVIKAIFEELGVSIELR